MSSTPRTPPTITRGRNIGSALVQGLLAIAILWTGFGLGIQLVSP